MLHLIVKLVLCHAILSVATGVQNGRSRRILNESPDHAQRPGFYLHGTSRVHVPSCMGACQLAMRLAVAWHRHAGMPAAPPPTPHPTFLPVGFPRAGSASGARLLGNWCCPILLWCSSRLGKRRACVCARARMHMRMGHGFRHACMHARRPHPHTPPPRQLHEPPPPRGGAMRSCLPRDDCAEGYDII